MNLVDALQPKSFQDKELIIKQVKYQDIYHCIAVC